MNEREAFLKAIKDDPRDLATRRAFADWLDEHDEPELADFHRQWTVEKYDEAEEWLEGFAEFLNNEGATVYAGEDRNPHLTSDDLMEAMYEHLRGGGDGIFLGFDTPDECWTKRGKMWECFELITGQKVAQAVKDEGPSIRCAC